MRSPIYSGPLSGTQVSGDVAGEHSLRQIHPTGTQAGNQHHRTHRTHSNSRGLTMLEVLIALFLLSIMTLGVSGLQEITLSAAIGSDHRTHAGRMVNSMAQFYSAYTRRNAQVTVLNRFIFDDTGATFTGNCNTAAIATTVDINVNAALTNFLNCWRASARDQLPAGRARIAFLGDPTVNPAIEIEVVWGNGSPRNRIQGVGG